MEKKSLLERLKAIRSALEVIDVHGSNNMNIALGVIQTLNGVIQEVEKDERENNTPVREGV